MTSEFLFARAQQLIPGGVNSPVRAFRSVGGVPFFTKSATGATLTTADGRELIDFVCTWGPAIHGHNHPRIKAAIAAALENGTSFGTPNPYEVEMAELIVSFFPSIQKVRMCSSGTEATMSAIRLARGFTKRDKIIKFAGCYHGHSDSLLIKAGSGALTHGYPDSAGIPASFARETVVLPYNDPAALDAAFAANPDQIACVILEPYIGNVGFIKADAGYLQHIRKATAANGALLIFDEVMTGFRVALGGAQERYGIRPDLTTLGKVIGGGMPVGAFGGRREIMEKIAPLGPVYQAGTLSGNPVAVAAGLATLKLVSQDGFAAQIEATTRKLIEGLIEEGARAKVAFSAQCVGSMFGLYFRDKAPTSFAEVMTSDRERFKSFFPAMLERGVYLAPSAFEAGFVSASHGSAEIADTLAAARDSLRSIVR